MIGSAVHAQILQSTATLDFPDAADYPAMMPGAGNVLEGGPCKQTEKWYGREFPAFNGHR